MRVELLEINAHDADVDLLCIGLLEGESLPEPFTGLPGEADVSTDFKDHCLLRPGRPGRLLVVGLGGREELSAERVRTAAAVAAGEARRLGATSIGWIRPATADSVHPASVAAALVAGTTLAAYEFDRFKSDDPSDPVEELILIGGRADDELASIVGYAAAASRAANRARDLQNLPANVADPAYIADRAREIASEHDGVEVEILGPAELEREGFGGLLAVGAGSAKDPLLVVLRYSGGGDRPKLGLVGKTVTFDTGGISLKPPATMHEMKMDMSGGAAVLEATAAIAELRVPIDLISVLAVVENMPGGSATRPGDIITQLNGKTVEVDNTDAEGRLVLADALTWCERQGAGRIVDVATLTGAVVVALGSTYAGLMANDDEWADEVAASGEIVGELVWRMPLHPEYTKLTKGKYADLNNAGSKGKAGTVYAAAFLEQFVEDVPWAHLDIAGTAWESGRDYVKGGATGFGTRLLVELARRYSNGS